MGVNYAKLLVDARKDSSEIQSVNVSRKLIVVSCSNVDNILFSKVLLNLNSNVLIIMLHHNGIVIHNNEM